MLNHVIKNSMLSNKLPNFKQSAESILKNTLELEAKRSAFIKKYPGSTNLTLYHIIHA